MNAFFWLLGIFIAMQFMSVPGFLQFIVFCGFVALFSPD